MKKSVVSLVMVTIIMSLVFAIPSSAGKPPKDPPAASHVIIVDKDGNGDFTSIQDAIDSITPSASDRYIIKVNPGIYTEKIDPMKSYIHLQGSGSVVTTIEYQSTVDSVITLSGVNDVIISGFTIRGGAAGIYLVGASNITITDNTIEDGNPRGILVEPGSQAVIKGNIIKNSAVTGVHLISCEATVRDNIITGHGNRGIDIYAVISATIIHNVITDNVYQDIRVQSGIPNISFNVYDTILGDTGVGLYNVTSDGLPAPSP